MKSNFANQPVNHALLASLMAFCLTCAAPALPEATSGGEARAAWDEIRKLNTPLFLEPSPAGKALTPEQEETCSKMLQRAGMCKAFRERYPDESLAENAWQMELNLLKSLVGAGYAPATQPMEELAASAKANPKTPGNIRFGLREEELRRSARHAGEDPDSPAILEQRARQLQQEFPQESQGFAMFLRLAEISEPGKARTLLREVLASPAAGGVKNLATNMLKKLDAVSKPLDIKFTAVDGREVDLAKMKGKVVLVDFWATWCAPCVAEIPKVKAAYGKFHDRGFEVVGISFDKEHDKAKLISFTAERDMPWPQYFDGKGWKNEYGQTFGIGAIPVMWLVDKRGNLRELNARADLADKVAKLLAE